MKKLAAYLQSLDPGLPRVAWVLEMGFLVNAFGSGVAYPFLVIYLHNVRGIPLGIAGLVLATIGVAALASGIVVGALVDRVGARRALTTAFAFVACGYGLLPFVREAPLGFLAAFLAGCGSGGFWPAQNTLLSALVPSERRHAAWGLQRSMYNLGIGVGGLTGGLIATTDHPWTFSVLFVVNIATFAGYLCVLSFVPEARGGGARAQAPSRRRGSYREVLRHRPFMSLVALNVGLITVGNAQLDMFPAFAKNVARVNERGIGLVFLVATLALVVFQLPVAKALEGRRRLRALALAPVLWLSAWLVIEAGGAWLEATAATALFACAALVFGLGECFHGPNYAPLVADLAPRDLQGRYWALSSNSWELGYIVGPAIGGFVLAAQPLALWPLAAFGCAVAAVAAVTLERAIPSDLRVTPSTPLSIDRDPSPAGAGR